MKTSYSVLSMLLLFCSFLMAQSQKSAVYVSPSDTKSNTSFFANDEYTLIAKPHRNIYISKDRNPCRVFIGVGTLRHAETGGLIVDYTVENTPATTYGVKEDDVILALDGVQVHTQQELESERDKHSQGDAFTLDILRDGAKMTINARFKACTEDEMEQALEQKLEQEQHFKEHLDRNVMHLTTERDPCKVFIGVYTSDFAADGKGVRVSGVIDGTPAKGSAVLPGDVILSLDNQPVNTNLELRTLRDKHQPGDQFRMTVLRDGSIVDINATFKSCPKNVTTPVSTPEVVEMTPDAAKVKDDAPHMLTSPETTLQLEVMDAYPNPTLGPLNIRFEAKAVPTTVRITDVAGKTVYNNELNQFNGFFNEQINLDGKSPGIYTVSIQQEGKVFAKKVVLLSRV